MATDWGVKAREIATWTTNQIGRGDDGRQLRWPGDLIDAIAALAAEAFAEGVKQRIEDLDLIKDGVCLVCGVDPIEVHHRGHAAGVAEAARAI